MSKRKKIIINIICGVTAIGVLVAAYFLFIHEPEIELNLGYTLINAPIEDVERILVRTAEFEFELANFLDEWSVWGSDTIELDQALTREFAIRASTIVSTEQVAESEADLARFGLDRPSGIVRLTLRDGEIATLQVGARTENEEYLYVNVAENPNDVYTLHESRVNKLLAPLDAVRNRNISPLNEDEISWFSITRTINGEVGVISMDMMDDTTAGNIAFQLATLTIAEFVDSPVNVIQAGIYQPSYVIEFGNAEQRVILHIGRQGEESELTYARIFPNSQIFMLNSEDIEFKNITVQELTAE